MSAWKDYIQQLAALIETQLGEQDSVLESYNSAEVEWIGAEREATLAISRMASKDQSQNEEGFRV